MTRLPVIALLAASTLVLGAPAMGAEAKDPAPTKGQAKLAKLIEGRTAGEPTSCIRIMPSDQLEVIDDTALVYRDGSRIWVNIPANPESLDDDDILVTYPTSGGTLCRLDRVETRDRSSQFYTGNIFLGNFIPYTKPAEGAQ